MICTTLFSILVHNVKPVPMCIFSLIAPCTTFYQTLFSFPLDGYSSCSLSAPINSGYTALLALSASPPVDYSDDEGKIHIGCQPRAWLYVVIVFAVVIFAAVVTFCVVFACVKLVIGKVKNSSINRSTDTTSPKVTTTFMNPSTVGYSSLPDYGSTPSAPPPPYK